MKLLTLLLIAGMNVYAQHGRAGGGMPSVGGDMSHAESASLGGSLVGNSRGKTSADSDHATKQAGKLSQQSPDTILERNGKLSSKLDSLLPAGTTADEACTGFKNLGNCVAAIHVSHNLGIPFEDLKDKMTGSKPQKLGTAIHSLRPEVNAKAEATKAAHQARTDVDESTKSTS